MATQYRGSQEDKREKSDYYLYESVLRCLAACTEDGNDQKSQVHKLAEIVRTVFEVDKSTHKKTWYRCQIAKPQNCMTLQVTVREAKQLLPMDPNGKCDPYAVLSLVKVDSQLASSSQMHRSSTRSLPASPITGKIRSRSSPSRIWQQNSSPKSARKKLIHSGGTGSLTRYPKRRVTSLDLPNMDNYKKTKVIQRTLEPEWNESFEFDVDNVFAEELQASVWDCDNNAWSHSKSLPGLRHLLSRITHQSVEVGSCGGDEFIGRCNISLKDLPVAGSDNWYDLYSSTKNQLSHFSGSIFLHAKVLRKSTLLRELRDSPESEQCSIEDFYKICRRLYWHRAQTQMVSTGKFDGVISENESEILEKFAIYNQISRLIQHIVTLIVLLEFRTCRQPLPVPDQVIMRVCEHVVVNCLVHQLHGSSSSMQDTSAARQGSLLQDSAAKPAEHQNTADRMQAAGILGTFEMEMLNRACDAMVAQAALPPVPVMFPYSDDSNWREYRTESMFFLNLCEVELWKNAASFKSCFAKIVTDKLEEDFSRWAKNRFARLDYDKRDWVGPNMQSLAITIHDACRLVFQRKRFAKQKHEDGHGGGGGGASECSSTGEQQQTVEKAETGGGSCMESLCERLNIPIVPHLAMALDKLVFAECQTLVDSLTSHLVRYRRYQVNVTKCSQKSLQLYLAMTKLRTFIRNNVPRHIKHVCLDDTDRLFEIPLCYWLQTFRNECLARIDKALQIESDVVTVTSLVKYSNSAVDVLSCFAKICTEWKNIALDSVDSNIMGVTKITDLICDGARQYVHSVHFILERQGYYAYHENEEQFDVTSQLCITLNNIEHVRAYCTKQLPGLLSWGKLHRQVVTDKGRPAAHHVSAVLARLLLSADQDIRMTSCHLIRKICEEMRSDLSRFVDILDVQPQQGLEMLLHYLDGNLKVLYERLKKDAYPLIVKSLWLTTLSCLRDKMKKGCPPSYYILRQRHMNEVREFFARSGFSECLLDGGTKMLEEEMRNILALNSCSSRNLILQYLHSVAEEHRSRPVDTSEEACGYLALKMIAIFPSNRLPPQQQPSASKAFTLAVQLLNAGNLSSDISPKQKISARLQVLPFGKPSFDTEGARDEIENVSKWSMTVPSSRSPEFYETFFLHHLPKEVLHESGFALHIALYSKAESVFSRMNFLGEAMLEIADKRQELLGGGARGPRFRQHSSNTSSVTHSASDSDDTGAEVSDEDIDRLEEQYNAEYAEESEDGDGQEEEEDDDVVEESIELQLKNRCVVMVALKQNIETTAGEFKVLEDRRDWDKEARYFVDTRTRLCDRTTSQYSSIVNKFMRAADIMS